MALAARATASETLLQSKFRMQEAKVVLSDVRKELAALTAAVADETVEKASETGVISDMSEGHTPRSVVDGGDVAPKLICSRASVLAALQLAEMREGLDQLAFAVNAIGRSEELFHALHVELGVAENTNDGSGQSSQTPQDPDTERAGNLKENDDLPKTLSPDCTLTSIQRESYVHELESLAKSYMDELQRLQEAQETQELPVFETPKAPVAQEPPPTSNVRDFIPARRVPPQDPDQIFHITRELEIEKNAQKRLQLEHQRLIQEFEAVAKSYMNALPLDTIGTRPSWGIPQSQSSQINGLERACVEDGGESQADVSRHPPPSGSKRVYLQL